MFGRSRSFPVWASAWALLLALGPGHAAQDAKVAGGQGPDARPPDEVYAELHRVGHRALGLIRQAQDIGAPVYAAPAQVIAWSSTLLRCDLFQSQPADGPRTADPEAYFLQARGGPDPKRVKAFTEHLKRMEFWEARFKRLLEKQAIAPLDYLPFQSARLEAEGWLSREMHKPL